MFSAERLLGGLIQGALSGAMGNRSSHRRNSFGSSLESSIGMGLVGLAIGAFEHYTSQSGQSPTAPSSMPGFQPGMSPPPPPPPGASQPAQMSAAPPPPPPPGPSASQEQPLLLIKAMLSAAAADGSIDDGEQQRILSQVQALGLGEEALQFVKAQIAHPLPLDALLQEVERLNAGPAFAEQVYLASLIAIAVDTDAERSHLARLASKLGLSAERAQAIQAQFS